MATLQSSQSFISSLSNIKVKTGDGYTEELSYAVFSPSLITEVCFLLITSTKWVRYLQVIHAGPVYLN